MALSAQRLLSVPVVAAAVVVVVEEEVVVVVVDPGEVQPTRVLPRPLPNTLNSIDSTFAMSTIDHWAKQNSDQKLAGQ